MQSNVILQQSHHVEYGVASVRCIFILSKIRGFYSGDYEECLLGCYYVWL
jgi:hypothetical protein